MTTSVTNAGTVLRLFDDRPPDLPLHKSANGVKRTTNALNRRISKEFDERRRYYAAIEGILNSNAVSCIIGEGEWTSLKDLEMQNVGRTYLKNNKILVSLHTQQFLYIISM